MFIPKLCSNIKMNDNYKTEHEVKDETKTNHSSEG